MSTTQIVITLALSATLLGLGLVFAWLQLRALRSLAVPAAVAPDDVPHFRAQAQRRLLGSALMGVLAILLFGSLFFEDAAQRVADDRAAARALDADAPIEGAQRRFVHFYTGYWIAFLLVLLGVIGIAFVDLMATLRFGRRRYRELQADRRAMIEKEVAQMRQQRNGHRHS